MSKAKGFEGSIALGVLAAVVLGPVMVAAALVAAVALAAAVFGIEISFLATDTPLDFLYGSPGGGGGGAFVQYVTFMISAMVAACSFSAIKWALTGHGLEP